ncbi:MAG: hypothetical protein ABNG97_09735 [Sulfitobacter sp.]
MPTFTDRKGAFRAGDSADLPAFEVATPRTDVAREAVDDELQDITLEVVLRMAGGADVFDDLDDISQPVESAVLTALTAIHEDAELTRVETATAPDGPEPIGLMLLTFKVGAQVAIGNPTP